MSKKQKTGPLGKILQLLLWFTGVIVSLAVAFGMIDGVLSVRFIPIGIMAFFGWVVVVTTILGVLVAIIGKLTD